MAAIVAGALVAQATFAQSGFSSITSNFNGTNIPAGDSIWFNSHIDASGITAGTIDFTGGSIDFTSNGKNYDLTLPNAQITFNPNATGATTSFNSATNTWDTVIGKGASGNDFLTGMALNLPNGLQGGSVKNITLQGTFSSTSPLNLSWQWSAAAYSSLPTDYNAFGVKAADNTGLGGGSDHAGTPENIKGNVVGGARGGGGANYTGSWSATGHVKTQPVPEPASMAFLGLGAIALFRRRKKA